MAISLMISVFMIMFLIKLKTRMGQEKVDMRKSRRNLQRKMIKLAEAKKKHDAEDKAVNIKLEYRKVKDEKVSSLMRKRRRRRRAILIIILQRSKNANSKSQV